MLEVSLLDLDESTFYGVKEVNIKGKNIDTPKKSVNLDNLRSDIRVRAEFFGEIYKTFSKERIKSLITDVEKQLKFNYDLNKLIRRAQDFSVEVIFFIPALDHLNPGEDELRFIIATQSQYSDLYIVPLVEHLNKLMKDGSFSIHDYINLINNYLDLLEGYPEKPAMGMVPINIPYQYIGDLMRLYLERGIESFCLDVGGRVALSLPQQITEVQKFLKENKIEAFIHATNINIGRAKKRSNIITAKDVLSFGLGFDSIGDNHLPPRIRDAGKSPTINLRLFEKETYGYHKIQEPSEIEEIYPEDTRVKPEHLLDESLHRRRKAQVMFNYEQLSMETERLRRVIGEGEIRDYLRSKRYVDEEVLKVITRVRDRATKMRSLEEFLG